LQHWRLARDAEIVVIDAHRGCGNGSMLPAGPLREPTTRLATVGTVVINGTGPFERAGALRMRVVGVTLVPVAGVGATVALAELTGKGVHAVAGIGNPERFFATLRAAGLRVAEHAFPDHHVFRATDLKFDDALPVLMTEKDAVKCRSFAPLQCWYLPVDAVFDTADERALLRRIFMDARLLDILACPVCKGPLQHERSQAVLVCRADRLAFPIRDDVPVMLEEEARALEPGDPLLER
jgi:tetraacyldisaccharide 4'-kinase